MGNLAIIKLMGVVIICALLNVLVQSTSVKRHRRVAMGTLAEIGQFPFAAHIYWYIFDESVSPTITSRQRCTGVIVHKMFVLTAANCFQQLIDFHKKRDNQRFEMDLGGNPTDIRAGFVDTSNKFSPKSQSRTGERLYVHDDYLHPTSMFDVDVALIRVNVEWDFYQRLENVYKIAIGKAPKTQDAVVECFSAGFGNFNTTRVKNSESIKANDKKGLPQRHLRLRFYQLRVGKVKFCKHLQHILNNNVLHVDEFYLCGDSTNSVVRRQTCFGDSGAPLVCDGLLLGVFSHRKENLGKPCDVNGFSLFTAVGSQEVRDWMLRFIPDLPAPIALPDFDPWDNTPIVHP